MGEADIELHNVSASVSRRQSGSPVESSSGNSQFQADNGIAYVPGGAQKSSQSVPLWSGESSNRTAGGSIRHFLVSAWRGPKFERDESPRPIWALRHLEAIPQKLGQKISSFKQLLILALYLLFWLFIWSKTLLPYLVETPLAADGSHVISLTCGQADSLWKGKNAACGLDAQDCQPPNDNVIIRCPALCDRGSWLYSSRAVGSQIVKYRGYFIGGGSKGRKDDTLTSPYRADSFPCGAAVHAGLVSPFFGGCAKISYTSGAQNSFEITRGHYGVSDSIGFSSVFPFSYVFKSLTASPSHCHDPRLLVLIVNVVLGAPVVFFAPGVVFYWTMAIVGFWTIVTATDPPVLVEPQDPESFYELVSVGLERFLPTCFILYVLWAVSVKRTFSQDTPESSRPSSAETLYDDAPYGQAQYTRGESPLSRLFLWYPLFWLGVLNNITFDRLPVDRLTWHDLQVQPGALLTVVIVASLLIVCVVAQAYYVWLSGRFWKLLSVYGGIFGGFFLLGNLPGLTLRIHHYIFGLVFIPGCSTRGRTALAFQGILLGLFLSGVARWGYASIAETNLSLLRGEPSGQMVTPEITSFDSGILYWQNPEAQDSGVVVDIPMTVEAEVSLLVNDIERFRGTSNGSIDIATLLKEVDGLRELLDTQKTDEDVPLYLRLAEYSEDKESFGDYTQAAVLKVPSFEFQMPPPGIT